MLLGMIRLTCHPDILTIAILEPVVTGIIPTSDNWKLHPHMADDIQLRLVQVQSLYRSSICNFHAFSGLMLIVLGLQF